MFTIAEIAIVIEMPEKALLAEIQNQHSKAYFAYYRGRLETKRKINQGLISVA